MRTYTSIIGLFIFLFFYSSFLQAQSLTPLDNPAPIIPNGEALEFKILVSTGIHAETYLKVTAPEDWKITGSTPAGIISEEAKNIHIPFNNILNGEEVSVFMKPGCALMANDRVQYELYTQGNQMLTPGTSPEISNINYPVFIFNIHEPGREMEPKDTTMNATMEAYREWHIIETENDAYAEGHDLSIQVTSQPGLDNNNTEHYIRILQVEMYTPDNGWEVIHAEIAEDQLSYRYTFTQEDIMKTGNRNEHLEAGEYLRVRERIRYDYCNPNSSVPTIRYSPRLIYTPSHICEQVKISGTETVIGFTNAYATNSILSIYRNTVPEGPEQPGKLIVRISNPTTNLVGFYDFILQIYNPATGSVWSMDVSDVYFCNASGTRDASATPLTSIRENNNINVRLNSSIPYKGLQDLDRDGICNDLTPNASDPIYIAFEWLPDFSSTGTCNGTNNYLYNTSWMARYSYRMFGCPENISTSTQWIIRYTNDNLGFSNRIGYIENDNLMYYPEQSYGEQTSITITESPANASSLNTSIFSNVSGVSHQVAFILPSDMKFVSDMDVKINNNIVSKNDITYEEDTRLLTFYNRDPSTITQEVSYTFGVETVPRTSTTNVVEIQHIFNWGNESYRYSCGTVPVRYDIYVPYPCEYIRAYDFDVTRTTLGYKDKNFTPFSSLEEAKAAGVELRTLGPYDNVEFRIFANVLTNEVDHETPLYGEVFYKNDGGALLPYFVSGKWAELKCLLPESQEWITIDIAGSEIQQGYEDESHHLRVNILPFLKEKGITLVKGTQLQLLIQGQTTEYLPNTPSVVKFFQLRIYTEGRALRDCNQEAENVFLWNYQLEPRALSSVETRAHLPEDLLFWQNGEKSKSLLLMLDLNNSLTSSSEIFPNEFRPNAKISSFTWSSGYNSVYAKTVVIDSICDSEGRKYYENIDYDVNYNTYGTVISFREGREIYTGSYYLTRDVDKNWGEQAFYMYAYMRSICHGDSNDTYNYAFINNLNKTDFPTSEKNEVRTSGFVYQNSHYQVRLWNISTTTTTSDCRTSYDTFSWPLRLENTSEWVKPQNGEGYGNHGLPNTYLHLEVSEGKIEEFSLYRIQNGEEIRVNAPFEEYSGNAGFRSYWIKIGNIEGESDPQHTGIYSKADFVLYAKHPNPSASGNVRIMPKFSVNTVAYPTNPYEGFTQYGGTTCKDDLPIASPSLTGTFNAMDFSGRIDEKEKMTEEGKFELCEWMPMTAKFKNNLFAPVRRHQVKVLRDKAAALELGDPKTTISYVKNNQEYTFDQTWEVDQSNEEYILISLPEGAVLDPIGEAGDSILVKFEVKPTCDFFFGKPIYLDMYGTSYANITERKNIATDNIRLDGYNEEENPVILLIAHTMEQLNTGHTGPSFQYRSEEDGIFRISGKFIFRKVDSDNKPYAYIKVLPNMRLAPNGLNELKKTDGTSMEQFVQVDNLILALFTSSDYEEVEYEFNVDLEVINPELWTCETKSIEVGALVSISMVCHPEDPVPCEVLNDVLSQITFFELEKYEVEFVEETVEFIEYYSATENRGKIEVKATIKNHTQVNIDDLEVFLYEDTNKNGIFDGEDIPYYGANMPLTRVDIGAQDETELHVIMDSPGIDLCDLLLVIPKREDINAYICDSTGLKPKLSYRLETGEFYICQTETLTLGDPPIPGYIYSWTTPGNGILSTPDNSRTTYRYPLTESLAGNAQTQSVYLSITRYRPVSRNGDPVTDCMTENIEVTVHIEPKYTQWNGRSTDWEYNGNWTNGIPGKCTYVTIPGSESYYPVLTRDVTDSDAAKCDTIEFLHGAEVAKTYLLDYNAAKVNLTLDPDRWTMITAPLRYMYTGDFHVNGYNPNAEKWGRVPHMYWMYYRMANPENEQYYNADYYWSMPFNVLEESLEAGKGIVMWPDLETLLGPTGKSGLMPPSDNKARFTFPRLKDEYYYYYGAGYANEGDREKEHTGSDKITDLPRKGMQDIDSLKSRFNYEGAPDYNPTTGTFTLNVHVNEASAPTALVGNPFMSHLKLYEFYQANSNKIKNEFYLWTNTNSGGFFDAVRFLNSDMASFVTTGNSQATIPPLQSFIITRDNTSLPFEKLIFSPDMSVTMPGSKLRSAPAVVEKVTISLYHIQERQSSFTLIIDEEKQNPFDKTKDQLTLFPAEPEPMVIYGITEENGNKKAVSIHTVGDLSQPVPLAIRTNIKGRILSFYVEDFENLADDLTIYLEDRKEKKIHNFRLNPYYTFNNYEGTIPEGRFYLRFMDNNTSIHGTGERKDFYIYATNCIIDILSEEDPLQSIEVYNLQGQKIQQFSNLNSEMYTFSVKDCRKQILILRIQTHKDLKVKKLLINP